MATKFTDIVGGNANYPSSGGLMFGGNSRVIAFQGTFDSGDIQIQASYDGGTVFIPLTDDAGNAVTISSNQIVKTELGNNILLRFVVTGSSGSTDVDVYLA